MLVHHTLTSLPSRHGLNEEEAHAQIEVPERVTRDAIAALRIGESLTEEAIDAEMEKDSPDRDERLDECDDAYHSNADDIAGRLFEFIKTNRHEIRLG